MVSPVTWFSHCNALGTIPLWIVAERERFELSVQLSPDAVLAGLWFKPLTHLSRGSLRSQVWRRVRDSNPR